MTGEVSKGKRKATRVNPDTGSTAKKRRADNSQTFNTTANGATSDLTDDEQAEIGTADCNGGGRQADTEPDKRAGGGATNS